MDTSKYDNLAWAFMASPLDKDVTFMSKFEDFIQKEKLMMTTEYLSEGKIGPIFICVLKRRTDLDPFRVNAELDRVSFAEKLKELPGPPIVDILCSLVSTSYYIQTSKVFQNLLDENSGGFFECFKEWLGTSYDDIMLEIEEDLSEHLPRIEEEIDARGNQ